MKTLIYNLPRNLIAGLAFLLAGSLALAVSVDELPTLPAAELPPVTFKLEQPIRVFDANDKPQDLVGMEDGQLVFTFPNMAGAEAIVEPDAKGMMINYKLPEDYSKWSVQSTEGNYRPMLRNMREVGDSIMRFLRVSPANTNFHVIARNYYEAVVVEENIGKAFSVALSMPWEYLSGEYLSLTEQLLFRAVEEERFALVETLLARLFDALPRDEFADMAFRIADALRTKERYDLTARIYGSVAKSPNETLSERSLLWAAYSYAVAGDPEQAREILESLKTFEREDENFLTYCLAFGRTGLAEGNVRVGLRYLSRAMVLTTIEATFKPELYYLLIRGYRDSGQEDAASRLVKEFEIFYPGNPWLVRLNSESLDPASS